MRYLPIIFVGGATALLAPSSQAQPRLDAVVVTATGRAVDPIDTPQAVEILSPQRASAAAPVGEMFRGEPGLAVQSDGAWGQNPVLRGLKKESVVVLVDGVRVNSAQPQGAIASFLDLGLLERAEVVKGPGSVLYGSGALGGVVNLLTPEPRFTAQPAIGGRIGLGAGSNDRSLSGALLLQRSNAEHALVLGAAARDAGDYRSPDGRETDTGYRSDTLLAKYRYRLSSRTSLKLNLQRHADHDVWYPGSARTGGQPGGAGIPPPLGTVTIHSPEQRRDLFETGIETILGPGRLEADLYRQEVFRQIRAYSAAIGRDYVRNDVTFATDGLRAKYLVPAGDRHLLTLGAESWRMRADPERYIDNNPPLFDNNLRNDPFDRGVLRSSGVFVQDEIDLGGTRVVAGARLDRVAGDAASKGAGPAAQTTGLDHRDTTLSWSLGATRALSERASVYANVGRGYRAADMRERFEDAARGDGYYHIGNPQLEPERSTSVELGVKGRDATLEYGLAAFHTRIDDYIAGRVTGAVQPATGLPVKRTENLDRAVIYGIEGSIRAPIGRLVGDAAFTWLRGTNRQDDEPLYQMPPPEVRVGIGQPAERGFHWRAQLRAVVRQNRVATRFSAGTEDPTPGFVTADLRFGWRFGKLGPMQRSSLDLRLVNLFDRRYHEHLVEGISGRELPAPGRGLILGLNGSF
ncbi:MAG: TonB-dependent receptor [Lautropia sp.]|nr:TonB-dependent receptor [Lautropia sp.]MCL4700962.1 TonB-dependent receptor [Burkholderiaceae bacterium]MCZ2413823.1 TonB-dependent receptor [Burkholderiales bacterium]MDL1907089.1 TonB-dependent receptor [Betaproteobacteria bacterium PRO1]RIK88858.1 MAG: TonB-dependent receptor [Burkholderiales bacterium]